MKIDLNKLKELAAKASPGPWHIGHVNEHEDSADIDNLEECLFVSVLRRDQAFICEARNALPKLIEVIERQQTCLKEYAFITVPTYDPLTGKLLFSDKNLAREALLDCEKIVSGE